MELLPGEEMSFDKGQHYSLIVSDEEINQKYVKGEVRIITEQARYPLPSISIMLNSNDYSLNPEFQRRHRWSKAQKSKLIESFIMNVPIPPIFLYEDKYSHYEVMDGLQRLTAIREFYSDKFTLQDLEQWPELNGRTYSNLPFQVKRGIDRRYLSSIILLQETAKELDDAKKLKQLVFERINSGGVKLEPQESRNAVFSGPMNDLCIRLARNPLFCKMWGIPEPTEEELTRNEISEELLENIDFKTMNDVELVLRFFANRQRNLFKGNLNFRDFLDNYLEHGNDFGKSLLEQLKSVFEDTIQLLYELLDEDAFKLYRFRNGKWNWFQRPATAVYDPLMLAASQFIGNKEILLKKKGVIKEILENFYQTNYSDFEGRNTNPGVLNIREEKMVALFKSLCE